MEIFKKFEAKLEPVFILKTAGIILLLIIGFAFVLGMLRSTKLSLMDVPGGSSVPGMGGAQRDDYALESPSMSEKGNVSMGAPERYISPVPPPSGGYVSGSDAEEFDVTEYTIKFETDNIIPICSAISDLKTRKDVVFESAHEYDRGCNYTFKALYHEANDIIAMVKGFHPKDFSENTYTIKRILEDVTSEIEILKRRHAAIEETLENAIQSYDKIMAIASGADNADALAKLIEGKLRIIERLTQERIQVASQLGYALRAEADQRDRLLYAYFNVQAVENVFVDKEAIKDSWNMAVRKFVRDVNDVLQGVTVRFAVFLLTVIEWALYAFAVLFIAKFGWHITKDLWIVKKKKG
ncbi:MAG: hypothetical protein G01um101470_485 [Parcubacteria group bacterium Gr01-1014_70]|nr:MAG: hypothetical protein G01um101470_485 [Parcubacteria group bacterium Gr01-1014_70]